MGATETLLQVEGLTKSYDGSSKALEGVSFSMNRGEFVSLIGSSGAGKSTLLRCINRLIDPTCGSVVFDGRETSSARGRALREIRRRMAMVFQGYNLVYRSTAIENVLQGRLGYKNSLMGALSIFTEEEKRAAFDALDRVGLGCCAYMRADQLSGGQKQRVGIARALASEPKVLLCDEATSALDPQTTRSILELIQDINRKLSLTVVVITHEMQVIKDICDKVAVIENGVIAEQGTVLDVFTNPQKPITKDFISVLLSNELPAAFRGGEVSKTPLPGAYLLLRLTFIGESADDPMLAGMIRKFPEIEVTMLFGNLDQIKSTPFGRMIIGITGPEAKIQEALQYLRQQDLKEEVIGYVRRHDSTSD